jgi:hypothetical protein
MKSRTLSLLAVVVSVALLSFSIAGRNVESAPPDATRRSWQHLAFPVDADKGVGDAEVSRKIVQLGDEGWELVGVGTFQKDGTTTKLVYFFKRPK